MSELDSLLDTTLDDLEDLPEFKNYCPGAHKVSATMEEKEVNSHPSVEIRFTYLEVLEIDASVPEEDHPKAGDECSVLCMLDNEYGRGNLKKLAAPFSEALGFSTIRECVEGVKGVECAIVSTLRYDKNDKDKTYMNVKELQVL